MGLFSFGSKDGSPHRRGADAKSARIERRSRRTERTGDADAMLLDPTLPEKQRARRRLVGAIALVIAAVIVLPMVLDSRPRPSTSGIAIDIPRLPANVPTRADNDPPEDAAAVPERAGESAAATGMQPPQPVPPRERFAKSAKTGQEASPPQLGKAAQSAAADNDAPSSAHDSPTASAKPQAQIARQASAAAGAGKTAYGAPNAPAGARFAVQLGVFADDASARQWEGKLKAVGVPAYVEHRKQADGSKRSLLRAGPFADRAAAAAAIAKVREAGLMSNAAH